MASSNNQAWYLGEDAGDLAYLHSVVGEQNIVPLLQLVEAPAKAPVLIIIDVDGVTDWERQLSEVDIGGSKVALVSSASMSQVFIRSMYGESPRRWYLGRLVSGSLPDSFVRALGTCLHGENELLKQELSDLREKLTTFDEVRESSAANELGWRDRIEQSEQKLADLTVDRDKLSADFAEAESRCLLVEEKLSSTERNLLDSREAGDHARKSVADVQDELGSLRTERATLTRDLDEMNIANGELIQLLDNNKAAVARLQEINSGLTNKLESSIAEVMSIQDNLQDEAAKVVAAVEAAALSKVRLDEANELFVIASRERDTAESQRDSAKNDTAEATKAQLLAEALAEKASAEVLESIEATKKAKGEASVANRAAAQAREDAEKAKGDAEARTLEAYGLLSDRTEALEEECILAANLGEQNRVLEERLDKLQAQLDGKDADLIEASSLATKLETRLDRARDESKIAKDRASDSELRAKASEKAATDSLEQAESANTATAQANKAASEAAEQSVISRKAESTAIEKMNDALALVDETALAKLELEGELERESANLASSELEREKLTHRVATISDEVNAAVRSHKITLSEVDLAYEQKVERICSDRDRALAEAEKELSDSLAKAENVAAKEMAVKTEVHEAEVLAMKVSYEHSKFEQQQRSQAQLATQLEKNNAAVAELELTHSAAIAELDTQREAALDALVAAHQGATALLRDEMAKLTARAEEADLSREASTALAESAAKQRDEAVERSNSANNDSALAAKRATEAELATDIAKASNQRALSDLEELRDSSSKVQAELKGKIDEASLQHGEQVEALDKLEVELIEKTEMTVSVIDERDKLSMQVSEYARELKEQAEIASKRDKALDLSRLENREISTSLVSLESIHAQHKAEFDELRVALDCAELTAKDTTARADTALDALGNLQARLEAQSLDYEGKISQLVGEMEKEKGAALDATKDFESQLMSANQQILRLESANTEAVMEIAKLRSDQTHAQSIVRPPPQRGKSPDVPVDFGGEENDVLVARPDPSDARARRLEEELADAKSRLRANSSGVVWTARREPEVKEGLLGRLKGTIRRSGDN